MRALLWCLVVACGRSEKDCPLEANALGTLLQAAAKESPSAIDIDPKVNLVVRDDLAQFVEHMAPIVTMRATETAYDGQVVDDAISKRLTSASKNVRFVVR